MNEEPDERLVHYTQETYAGSFKADLVEQYKLYVQSADNVSARRVSSGRYLLTVNAALVALYGFQPASSVAIYLLTPIPIVGIAISLLSFNIIKSHGDLNAIKFKVIHELERHLPASIYHHEWKMAEEGHGKSYWPVSKIELGIPMVFLVLHGIALIFIIVFLITGLPEWA